MAISYSNVRLRATAALPEQLPAPGRPEVAFVGRSNVGKSSLMNKLFGRKNLVRVSAKPGKTTTINFFSAGEADFVDLPGYGFARVPAAEQRRWSRLMDAYFEGGRNVALVVALVDIRHSASPLDERMIDYLLSLGLPFCVAFTKADKLSRQKGQQQAAALVRALTLPSDVPTALVSAVTGAGVAELRAIIEASLA